MQFKGLRRCGEQVSGEETEALLAHIYLRELVCERTDARRLIGWSLAKPWLVDVLRLRLRSSIVRRLPWLAHLLLCELALRRETGSEELRRLRRLAWDRTVRGPCRSYRGCNRVRTVVCLRLTCCILPTFCVMVGLRRRGCGRGGVHCRIHALGIRKRRLPLCPPRRGFCTAPVRCMLKDEREGTHR